MQKSGFEANVTVCVQNIYRKKGFTLIEMLITLAVIGILTVTSVPLLTQFSTVKTGQDKNVGDCITKNNTSAWYDTGNGTTTIPDSATDPTCYAAVINTKFERGSAYITAQNYADRGTDTQKTVARQILRAACDAGGIRACEYFIDRCRKDGGTSCNTADYSDLRHYLVLPVSTDIAGISYMTKRLSSFLGIFNPNIVAEVVTACDNPENGITNNIACSLVGPKFYITACNNGVTTACASAWTHNWNKGCDQILTAYPEAQTGTYKIPYNSSGASVSVTCNMDSRPKAIITGCDGARLNPALVANGQQGDCYQGLLNNYNKTCQQIFDNWSGAAYGTYTVTVTGWDSPSTDNCTAVSAEILESDACHTNSAVACADGSYYIGLYHVGDDFYRYYTTDSLQGPYPWTDGVNTTRTSATSWCFPEGLSYSNGAGSSANITYYDDLMLGNVYMHKANGATRKMFHGKNDWFLISNWEMNGLRRSPAYRSALWSSYIWSSTPSWWNCGQNGIMNCQSGNCGYDSPLLSLNVRPVRKVAASDAFASCKGTEAHLQSCKIDGKAVIRVILAVFGANITYLSDNYWVAQDIAFQNPMVATGATSTTDGLANTDTLTNPANGFTVPAAAACRAFGANWYLPAINELVAIDPFRKDNTNAWGFVLSSTEVDANNAKGFLVGRTSTLLNIQKNQTSSGEGTRVWCLRRW